METVGVSRGGRVPGKGGVFIKVHVSKTCFYWLLWLNLVLGSLQLVEVKKNWNTYFLISYSCYSLSYMPKTYYMSEKGGGDIANIDIYKLIIQPCIV